MSWRRRQRALRRQKLATAPIASTSATTSKRRGNAVRYSKISPDFLPVAITAEIIIFSDAPQVNRPPVAEDLSAAALSPVDAVSLAQARTWTRTRMATHVQLICQLSWQPCEVNACCAAHVATCVVRSSPELSIVPNPPTLCPRTGSGHADGLCRFRSPQVSRPRGRVRRLAPRIATPFTLDSALIARRFAR